MGAFRLHGISQSGYKSTVSICRRFGFIRKGKVTDGARYDGRMLRDVVTNDNTASDVWADTAYRSQANERWLRRRRVKSAVPPPPQAQRSADTGTHCESQGSQVHGARPG